MNVILVFVLDMKPSLQLVILAIYYHSIWNGCGSKLIQNAHVLIGHSCTYLTQILGSVSSTSNGWYFNVKLIYVGSNV